MKYFIAFVICLSLISCQSIRMASDQYEIITPTVSDFVPDKPSVTPSPIPINNASKVTPEPPPTTPQSSNGFQNPSTKVTSTEIIPSQTSKPTPTFVMCSPLEYETIPELWEIISDPYHPPPPGRDERHHGVDFSHYQRKDMKSIQGEKVQAILPGIVSAVINNRLPYGNMVIISTEEQYFPSDIAMMINITPGLALYHLYAHLEASSPLRIGDFIECGDEIGSVGMTGYNIVNPHLHLETRIGIAGVSFESMVFYDTSAIQVEIENYKRWRTSGEFQHFDPMILFNSYLLYIKQQPK